MKKKMFIADWHIFPFDVLVCLGSEREDILSKIKSFGYKLNDEESDILVMKGHGRSVMLEGGQTILWLKNYPKHGSGTLAHEIFHAVQFITDRVGIKMTAENDELFAYMTEYLTNEIGKKI